ncbi:hypothetical protein NS234_12150 [Microbacterium oxydans]|nr:hypothetical protein NS234_12150 [Microbacterium oxydans]
MRSEFSEALAYEWASLQETRTHPPRYPEWVQRLEDRLELWLDGEDGFRYLQLTGSDDDAVSAERLQVFAITQRFALMVVISRVDSEASSATDTAADRRIDWHFVPREAITQLDIFPKSIPGKEWLALTASYEGLPEPVTFPPDLDLRLDEQSRKALFLELRDDLFPTGTIRPH